MTNQIPPPTNRTNREKYGFSKFEVGHSEFYQDARSRVGSAAIMFCKRNRPEWKFKTSIEPSGVRVWRVK